MITTHEAQVRDLLQQWATATRKGAIAELRPRKFPVLLQEHSQEAAYRHTVKRTC
jgi:hypothetical protein